MPRRKFRYAFFLFTLITAAVVACKKDKISTSTPPDTFKTTPYVPPVIQFFRTMPVDDSNPMTMEGIALGRKLFFDPILSKDSSLSCEGCHRKESDFSDPRRFSLGVDGIPGTRNAPALVNLAWFQGKFFWDGRVNTLREQAVKPIENEIEMHLPMNEAVQRIQRHPEYVAMFKAAFNTETVTADLLTRAIEQFEKTLVSYNAPYDKYLRSEQPLTASQLRGLQIFNSEKGDCFHCHTTPELFVHPTKIFSNNGMDSVGSVYEFADPGLGAITHDTADYGKFKIPTLRNLAFTAPYMHDGRFATLDEVIDSYNKGPRHSPTVDPIMIEKAQIRLANTGFWGLNLSDQDKADLKAFLLSLSDSSYVK